MNKKKLVIYILTCLLIFSVISVTAPMLNTYIENSIEKKADEIIRKFEEDFQVSLTWDYIDSGILKKITAYNVQVKETITSFNSIIGTIDLLEISYPIKYFLRFWDKSTTDIQISLTVEGLEFSIQQYILDNYIEKFNQNKIEETNPHRYAFSIDIDVVNVHGNYINDDLHVQIIGGDLKAKLESASGFELSDLHISQMKIDTMNEDLSTDLTISDVTFEPIAKSNGYQLTFSDADVLFVDEMRKAELKAALHNPILQAVISPSWNSVISYNINIPDISGELLLHGNKNIFMCNNTVIENSIENNKNTGTAFEIAMDYFSLENLHYSEIEAGVLGVKQPKILGVIETKNISLKTSADLIEFSGHSTFNNSFLIGEIEGELASPRIEFNFDNSIEVLSNFESFRLQVNDQIFTASAPDISIKLNKDTLNFNYDAPTELLIKDKNSLSNAFSLQLTSQGVYYLNTRILSINSLIDNFAFNNYKTFEQLINLDINLNDRNYTVSLVTDALEIIGEFNQVFDEIKLKAEGKDFLLTNYKNYFENFLPEQIFKAIETSSTDFLIDVTTSLDFNSISYNADVNMHHVNLQENYKNVPISINFSGNRKEIEIRKAAIDLRDILFTYSGTLQYRNPLENLEGNLQIFEQNQKDQLVTDIHLRNIQDQIVAKIDFPLIPAISYSSIIYFDDNQFKLDGLFSIKGVEEYPLLLLFDLNDMSFNGNSTDLFRFDGIISASEVTTSLSCNEFLLPDGIGILSNVTLTLDALFNYKNIDDWLFSLSSSKIENVEIVDEKVSLYLDATMDSNIINISSLQYTDSIDTLLGNGTIEYSISDERYVNGMFILGRGNESYSINASYTSEGYRLLVDVENGNIEHSPVFLGKGVVNGSIDLMGSNSEYFIDFGVNVDKGIIYDKLYLGDIAGKVTQNKITLENFSGSYGNTGVNNLTAEYDLLTGNITVDGTLLYNQEVKETSVHVAASTNIKLANSLEKIRFQDLLSKNFLIYFSFDTITVNNEKIMDDFNVISRVNNGNAIISGGKDNSISAILTKNGGIAISFAKGMPFQFDLTGEIKNGIIDAQVKNISVELPFLTNFFRYGLFDLKEGELYGALDIIGSLEDPEFFGELYCDYGVGKIGIFKDPITAYNIVVNVSEKELISLPVKAKVGNALVDVRLSSNMDKWFPIDYQVDFRIPENSGVSVEKTFIDIGVNYTGEITGNGILSGTNDILKFNGSLLAKNGIVSLDNSIANAISIIDYYDITLNLRTGKNLEIKLPTVDVPIVQAAVSDNQVINIIYDNFNKNTQVTGQVALRGGEIFYFRRNFYMENGTIRFKKNADGRLEPVIDVRAKIRDYDSSGNKIDIFLILKNSSLKNISPVFESRPILPLDDIVRILGQNILPEEAAGTANITSALAIASLATEVIQKIGLLTIDPIAVLENSIRNTFKLDLFSIRTQIFQNIILDTIPGDYLNDTLINPLARYLDNTTIFLGKYINNDIFLQGIIQLTSNETFDSGFFLTNELSLDVEVGMEWENPLNTFTITTNPLGFNISEILNTLSFGVTWNFSF